MEKEIEEEPILITGFYSNMLIDFEPLGTDKRKSGIGNILYFEKP